MAESAQFTRELYGTGRFEIHIHPDQVGALDLAKRGNIIVINGDGNKSGIVRDFGIAEDRGRSQVVIYGETGAGLMRQRVTVPPTNTQAPGSLGWDRVRGNAETVMKHYINRNLVNPFDVNRGVPRLVIADNQGRGETFPWQTRFQRLSDELANIGNFAEMGFSFAADTANKQWVFDVIDGTDRSKRPENTSPVVFRMEHSSIDGYRYAEDFSRHRTTGYALGAGEDENRMMHVLGASVTGLDRFEEVLDLGSPENIDELISYGGQRLNEFQEVKTVEANALPKTFKFEKDYFLGDLVTVHISRLGLELNTRITSVTEIWQRNDGYQTDIRFGGELPNVFTIWNRREEVR